ELKIAEKGLCDGQQALETLSPSSPADKLVAQVPLGHPAVVAVGEPRNETPQTEHGGSWAELLQALLVVISVPVICSLCRGPRAGYVRYLRKMSPGGDRVSHSQQ